MKERLVIINNEKCVIKNSGIYCQNLELKSLPEGLNSHFNINLILRKSNVSAIHKIDVNNIDLSNNILGFIINLLKEFTGKDCGQLFLHYNKAGSKMAKENYLDGRPMIGLPTWFKGYKLPKK